MKTIKKVVSLGLCDFLLREHWFSWNRHEQRCVATSQVVLEKFKRIPLGRRGAQNKTKTVLNLQYFDLEKAVRYFT